MADDNPGLDPAIGDLVRALAALLDEANLSEIEYAEGQRRIRVARGTAVTGVTAAAAAPVAAAPPAAPATPAPPAEAPGTVKSPMVGTIYLAPQPEAEPYIKVGDRIREGQTLLIVEAMKVMNHIAAPRAGRVVAILVADGMPVEFGQPLLVLE